MIPRMPSATVPSETAPSNESVMSLVQVTGLDELLKIPVEKLSVDFQPSLVQHAGVSGRKSGNKRALPNVNAIQSVRTGESQFFAVDSSLKLASHAHPIARAINR